jgi:acetyl-CoA C-acetyltransferase
VVAALKNNDCASLKSIPAHLPMSKRDILKFEGFALARQRALSDAKVQLKDLSFVETHDCFTIPELIEYEAMGLTGEGRGVVAALEGWTQIDGRLPINPSGGLKAKGHPIGATGVSMHVLTAPAIVRRHAGADSNQQRAARRRFQHGWRSSRKLRQRA